MCKITVYIGITPLRYRTLRYLPHALLMFIFFSWTPYLLPFSLSLFFILAPPRRVTRRSAALSADADTPVPPTVSLPVVSPPTVNSSAVSPHLTLSPPVISPPAVPLSSVSHPEPFSRIVMSMSSCFLHRVSTVRFSQRLATFGSFLAARWSRWLKRTCQGDFFGKYSSILGMVQSRYRRFS